MYKAQMLFYPCTSQQLDTDLPVYIHTGLKIVAVLTHCMLCLQVSLDSSGSNTIYTCSLCGKTFGSGYSLRRHENAHRGIYRFRCTYCSKGFTDRSHLRGHIGSQHTHQREFVCCDCGKGFSYSWHYKAHIRICSARRLMAAAGIRPQIRPPSVAVNAAVVVHKPEFKYPTSEANVIPHITQQKSSDAAVVRLLHEQKPSDFNTMYSDQLNLNRTTADSSNASVLRMAPQQNPHALPEFHDVLSEILPRQKAPESVHKDLKPSNDSDSVAVVFPEAVQLQTNNDRNML